jgi:hypothetical protein
MEREPSVEVRVDPDSFRKTIEACRDASDGMYQILQYLHLHGQSAQVWADDTVSHDIASYYTEKLWAGGNCTYSALNSYYEELLSIIDSLSQTLASYNNVESTTTTFLDQL